jgi:hypothetical protein
MVGNTLVPDIQNSGAAEQCNANAMFLASVTAVHLPQYFNRGLYSSSRLQIFVSFRNSLRC